MEDFEAANIHWDIGGAGAGNAVALDAAIAQAGENSCKLTAGAGAAGSADISRYFGAAAVGKIGCEASFQICSDTKYALIGLTYDDGTNKYLGVIRYNRPNHKIQYLYGGVYEDIITGVVWHENEYCFHTMKFVIDVEKKEYVRVIVGDTEVDMSGIALRTMPIGTSQSYYIMIEHESDHAAAKDAYVDNIILTQKRTIGDKNMLEAALVAGIVAPVFAIQIYNARQISELKNKIELIYDNLDVKLDFKSK